MKWMICFLLIMLINSIAGSAYYLYWVQQKRLLEQKNEYFKIYRILKLSVLFYILPGPVLFLLKFAYWPLLYQMEWISMQPGEILSAIVQLLSVLWIAGVCVSLVQYIKNFLYVKKIMEFNSELERPEQIACFQDICRRLRFYRAVHVYENSYVKAPMIIGPMKNNILFPAGRYQDEEFAIILEHEIIHAKHHDLFVQNMLTWLSILFWFMPAVRKERVAMEDWCETACDITMCSSDTSVWTKKEYFRPMITHMPVKPVDVRLALAFNTDQLELMVRMKRMKAYDADGHRELTITEKKIWKQILLVFCFAVTAVGFSQYMKNQVYVNLTRNKLFSRQQSDMGSIQKNEYIEAGADCHTRWIYCKEGESLTIITDVSIDGQQNAHLMAGVQQAGGNIVQNYYLSETGERNVCEIPETGFYRVEFSQEAELAYHLIYRIN